MSLTPCNRALTALCWRLSPRLPRQLAAAAVWSCPGRAKPAGSKQRRRTGKYILHQMPIPTRGWGIAVTSAVRGGLRAQNIIVFTVPFVVHLGRQTLFTSAVRGRFKARDRNYLPSLCCQKSHTKCSTQEPRASGTAPAKL